MAIGMTNVSDKWALEAAVRRPQIPASAVRTPLTQTSPTSGNNTVLWNSCELFLFYNSSCLPQLISYITQGPQVYQTKFGPSYRVSYCTSIALLTVTVIMILFTWFLVSKKDKRITTQSRAAEDGEIGGGVFSDAAKKDTRL